MCNVSHSSLLLFLYAPLPHSSSRGLHEELGQGGLLELLGGLVGEKLES